MRLLPIVLGAAGLSAGALSCAALDQLPTQVDVPARIASIDSGSASVLGVPFAQANADFSDPSTGPSLAGVRLGASAPLGDILYWCTCECLEDYFDGCFDFCDDCGSDCCYEENRLQIGFGTQYHLMLAPTLKGFANAGYSYDRESYDYRSVLPAPGTTSSATRSGFSDSSSSNNLRLAVGVEWEFSPQIAVRPSFGFTHSLTYDDTSFSGGLTADYRWKYNLGFDAGVVIQAHAISYLVGVIYYLNMPRVLHGP